MSHVGEINRHEHWFIIGTRYTLALHTGLKRPLKTAAEHLRANTVGDDTL